MDEAFGKTKSYSGMQDSWSAWCQGKLDHEIQRGVSKEVTQREHVHAEIIAPALRLQDEIQNREKTIRKKKKQLKNGSLLRLMSSTVHGGIPLHRQKNGKRFWGGTNGTG